MGTVYRTDPITLNSTAQEQEFERFVTDELLPTFKEHYSGPTRRSEAYLTSQRLLKEARNPRHYLWLSVWDGPAENVEGSAFENAVVGGGTFPETEAALRKLETFGKREAEHVFDLLADGSAVSSASA